MKKILLKLFILLVLSIVSNKLSAQVGGSGTTNYIPKWTASTTLGNSIIYESSSKIGIGTTSPNYLLHQYIGSASANYHQFANSSTANTSSDGTLIGIDGSGNFAITNQEASSLLFSNHNGIAIVERMRIASTGNVGIATTSPSQKFQVDLGHILMRGPNNFASANHEAALYMGDVNHYIKSVNGYGLKIGTYQAADAIKIAQTTGRVIVGGATQSGGSHDNSSTKLTVNGKIVAKEIYATTSNWADFVFNADYKLLPLNEVEEFIVINKHLPFVPSEVEILKTGNNLGETDAILLRKIEELTLYIIDQNKRIAELENKIINGN